MRAMAILYIGPHRNPDFQSDYQLSPILAPDRLLAQFPPLLMTCGEKDPFVDDTLIFAGRVREAKRARRAELERIIAGKSSQFGEGLRMSTHADDDDDDEPSALDGRDTGYVPSALPGLDGGTICASGWYSSALPPEPFAPEYDAERNSESCFVNDFVARIGAAKNRPWPSPALRPTPTFMLDAARLLPRALAFASMFFSSTWPRIGASRSRSTGEDGYDLDAAWWLCANVCEWPCERECELWKDARDESDEVEARRESVPLA